MAPGAALASNSHSRRPVEIPREQVLLNTDKASAHWGWSEGHASPVKETLPWHQGLGTGCGVVMVSASCTVGSSTLHCQDAVSHQERKGCSAPLVINVAPSSFLFLCTATPPWVPPRCTQPEGACALFFLDTAPQQQEPFTAGWLHGHTSPAQLTLPTLRP